MINPGEKVVIALGGNTLIKKGEKPTLSTQTKNAKKTLEHFIPLIKNKNKLVITHGSGPQIGAIILQNELSRSKVPPMPMDILDAEVQGGLGYLLEQTLQNTLNKHKIKIPVVSILTQIIVNKKDPAFKNPTKPIGPYYTKRKANLLRKKGLKLTEQFNRGYRRIVPSPKPKYIDDVKIIDILLKNNTIVIAAGGGGIPVIKEKGKLKGVSAVIDKDYASSCLATSIKAKHLIILTEFPYVHLNYQKKNQKRITKIKINELKKYLKQGQFQPGSMGPKIESSINFIKKGGKQVIITSTSHLNKALKGKAGTIITK